MFRGAALGRLKINPVMTKDNFCWYSKKKMDVGRRRKAVETVYDKPLPLKGKPEVGREKGNGKRTLLWLYLQLFAMARSRTLMTDFVFPLQVNVGTFAFLFSEMVQYSNSRVTSLTQLHEKLANVKPA